jgi:hypothetical protein
MVLAAGAPLRLDASRVDYLIRRGGLVVVGLVATSAADLEKSDAPNINLLAGIGMVVVAAAFLVWARMRPVVVPERPHGKGFGQEQ